MSIQTRLVPPRSCMFLVIAYLVLTIVIEVCNRLRRRCTGSKDPCQNALNPFRLTASLAVPSELVGRYPEEQTPRSWLVLLRCCFTMLLLLTETIITTCPVTTLFSRHFVASARILGTKQTSCLVVPLTPNPPTRSRWRRKIRDWCKQSLRHAMPRSAGSEQFRSV